MTQNIIAYATGGLAVASIRTSGRVTGVGLDADGNPIRPATTPFSTLTARQAGRSALVSKAG